MCEEIHDSEIRKRNLIVFDIDGQRNTTVELGGTRNCEAVKNVSSVLLTGNDFSPRKYVKLGRINIHDLRSCPIKAVFNFVSEVVNCIRNARKIKSSERF